MVPNLLWPNIYFSSSDVPKIYQSCINTANPHTLWTLQHFFHAVTQPLEPTSQTLPLLKMYTTVFQPFCCKGTFWECLRCSWNPMQWSKCLYCYTRIELLLWTSSQANSVCFSGTPVSHLWNPEVPRNLIWKPLSCITIPELFDKKWFSNTRLPCGIESIDKILNCEIGFEDLKIVLNFVNIYKIPKCNFAKIFKTVKEYFEFC